MNSGPGLLSHYSYLARKRAIKHPMRIVCSLFLLLTCFSGRAQDEKVKLVNSRDILTEGVKLYDEGRYDEAISKYKTVSRNDTNYLEVLAELAITYIANKQNQQAIDICHEALKQPSPFQFNIYNSLGSALDDMNRSDEAIAAYKEGIKKYPYKFLLQFNLGLAYLKAEKRDSAIPCFRQSIMLNPYHASSHLRLGMIYLDQGRVIPAMLALNFFLALEPNTERANSVVLLLDKVAGGEYEFDKTKLVDPSKFKDDDFSEVELLFNSKIALSKKYKPVTRIDFPITKQMQLILEKLKFNAGDKGFCMQTYVPFFVQMQKDKWYPTFAYWSLASVNFDKSTNWLKKNQSKIKQFATWENTQVNKMREMREEMVNGRMQMVQHFYYSDNSLQALGNLGPGEKDKQKTIGDWEFYTPQGNLSARGSFTPDGDRNGDWKWYYPDGSLSQLIHFNMGVQDGIAETYFTNGAKSAAYTYVDGKLNGETREYYSTGVLKQVVMYKDGKKNGHATYYHPTGNKMYEADYKDDQLDGAFMQWHENGQVDIQLDFINGKREGPAKYYYSNGQKEEEGFFKADNQVGEWKGWYKDGSMRFERSFNDKGQLNGIYKSWFRNGKEQGESVYADGKLNGTTKEFARDGTLITALEYKDDAIQSYKCYDKSGAVIVDGNKPGRKVLYAAKYQNGNKRAEGEYLNGKQEGSWTYYDIYGSVKSKEIFKDGQVNGSFTEYYDNGQVSSDVEYKNGQPSGYYRSYFRNGKLKSEGWYVDGQQQGDWYFYEARGTVSTHNYFINDTPYGWQEYFTPGGWKEKEEWYQYGYVNKAIFYDSLGNVTDKIDLDKGTGPYVIHYPNGKVRVALYYKNSKLDGKAQWYDPDGTLSEEGTYRNDKREGNWKNRYVGGKLFSDLNYDEDRFNGECKWYYENGNISTDNNYYNGMLDGVRKTWHDNKQPEREAQFEDDQAVGTFSYYSPDGQLIGKRNFEDNIITSYTYLDKTGKLVDPVKFVNETGKIVCYFQNGNKSIEQEYQAGMTQGHRIEYYSNGTVYKDEFYKDDTREGTTKYFYSNGATKIEENYYLDELDGPARYYYDNGKLEKEGAFVLGDAHGQWKYYDKNGKLIEIRTYVYGALYEIKKP